MLVYEAINEKVLAKVPSSAARVLDLGCGCGAFGRALKERQACEVIGVTYSEAEATSAREALDQVLVRDLNSFDPREAGADFDCIVCSHVLEHLYHPEGLLRPLQESLCTDGTLVVALPNVLLWRQRLQFLLGRFRYTDGGLMDRTHFRFYDFASARALLRESGYQVDSVEAEGCFPYSRFLPAAVRGSLDGWALRKWPGFFGFQFVLACHAMRERV